MERDKPNIGIVTSPLGKAGEVPLSNLIHILCSLSNDIYVVTGKNFSGVNISYEKLRMIGVKHKEGTNAFTKIINHTYEQLELSRMLSSKARNVDFYIFFIGGESALLPMLTTKLLRKKVALMLVGNPLKIVEVTKDTLGKILRPLRKIKLMLNLMLSNKIIIYSENIVKERGLEKYRSKLSVAHEHFLDLVSFNVKKKIKERRNLVGYLGRLSEEKGVLNIINAISSILEVRKDIKFFIGGDGDLASRIRQSLNENGKANKVKITEWIPHENLPDYLNELKLLVLPSYTEGLPNIMLEAMACGTPILATSVGAIPGIIKNGKNGFLLENNSPECITKNILEILDRKDLQKISHDARKTVEGNFTYKAAVEQFEKIVNTLRSEGACLDE